MALCRLPVSITHFCSFESSTQSPLKCRRKVAEISVCRSQLYFTPTTSKTCRAPQLLDAFHILSKRVYEGMQRLRRNPKHNKRSASSSQASSPPAHLMCAHSVRLANCIFSNVDCIAARQLPRRYLELEPPANALSSRNLLFSGRTARHHSSARSCPAQERAKGDDGCLVGLWC